MKTRDLACFMSALLIFIYIFIVHIRIYMYIYMYIILLCDLGASWEEKIASAFCQQKRLADEKLRAVACKAMASTALDVVADAEQRRGAQLRQQLRRRRRELRRSVASYVRKQREALSYRGEEVSREVQEGEVKMRS